MALAQGAGGAHYRTGWEAAQRSGKPRFDTPVQRLPGQTGADELRPLRTGQDPYRATPGSAASEPGR